MKRYYLVTTEHLEDALWFRDQEDFAVGMNMVAVQASMSLAVVLVFILMSNHVHFVLYGTREEVEVFIQRFKGRYSQYYCRKWHTKELLRLNKVDIKELPGEQEARERAIAYVMMNCVAAGICTHPSLYPWGCGSALFAVQVGGIGNYVAGGDRRDGISEGKLAGSSRKIGGLSRRAQARLLHSTVANLPDEWAISDAGYVLPESYIGVNKVEQLFRTPQRLDYFLRTSSKAKRRLEIGEELIPAFKDQVILGAIPDLCQSLFQKNRFEDLAQHQKTEVLRQLRYRFSACPNQLARVCGLTYDDTARLLDAV